MVGNDWDEEKRRIGDGKRRKRDWEKRGRNRRREGEGRGENRRREEYSIRYNNV
jgi:hypothetical protein